MSRDAYSSWGRLTDGSDRRAVPAPADATALASIAAGGARLLAYGNGRSYGDSCHNDGGLLLDCRGRNRILSFDAATGRLVCEAGVLLADITARTLPAGWFLPVTPGTSLVTVGGAIANDVHGKNHHRRGTFGRHVCGMTLLGSDGRQRTLSPHENVELYGATIGGLGLTGLIATAELQLMTVRSGLIEQRTRRFHRLEQFPEIAAEADRGYEYSVAWIDSTATGAALGRGLFLMGNHAEAAGRASGPRRHARLGVPFAPPVPLINRASLTAFNSLYWHRPRGDDVTALVPFAPFFYPLDAIRDWNRLYGPRGLYQHQCVLPGGPGLEAVREMLALTHRAGIGSFLTVLKVFGAAASPGLLSFPRPGLTLTLDFPNTGVRTLSLLDALDRVVVAAGGAVCPYKDARMLPATFAASFPRWRALLPHVDPAFSSSFWRRVTEGLS